MKKKLSIAIIGAKGMLGSDLVLYLHKEFHVTGITKENYKKYQGQTFDIVVNANGNSRRFWGNAHSFEDFIASTESVYKSILDFPAEQYIYISSSDVYVNHANAPSEDTIIESDKLSSYGFHKFLSELLVTHYAKNYLILRSCMILGTKLKKGPFFDITHKRPLFISKKSSLQLITTRAIAEIINVLTKRSIKNEIFNMGGKGTFSFENIYNFFKQTIKFQNRTEVQRYDLQVEKLKKHYPLKSSEEYLKDYLHG